MDLLIKDMGTTDRPIKLVLYPNGDVDHLTEDNRYETIAKAIEIPPHEELIDKDAVLDILRTYLQMVPIDEGIANRIYEIVYEAPIVLEESNGKK